jgi:glyoxylase I family protein
VTRGLHHVALGARDVERVAGFYRDVFGLPELARHADASGELRSIWLGAAGTIVMVEKTEQTERRAEGVGAGPFLLAFSVSVEERAALEHALEAAGAAIEARSAFSSYARDPEGNRIAISHHPDRE